MNRMLLGLVIGLLLIGSIAATYKFSLSQYTEECFSHHVDYTYEEHCRCNSAIQYLMICNWECCNCPQYGRVYYNTTIVNITGKCEKYHLVRYANGK